MTEDSDNSKPVLGRFDKKSFQFILDQERAEAEFGRAAIKAVSVRIKATVGAKDKENPRKTKQLIL